jgi:hypothetical protein
LKLIISNPIEEKYIRLIQGKPTRFLVERMATSINVLPNSMLEVGDLTYPILISPEWNIGYLDYHVFGK